LKFKRIEIQVGIYDENGIANTLNINQVEIAKKIN